jgi:methionine sulfoxide reductase heme-binding subunit
VVWALCLTPLALLVWWGARDGLGANPIERITHWTGQWALVGLLATLAVTPLRRATGINGLIRYRRLLGLFAFFYATLHVLTYFALDHFFDLAAVVEDIRKRPFITAGFAAFVLLLPLAATSTTGMIRRLGRNWARLHALVYVAAGLGVLHFLWLVKADTRRPLLFAAALLVLLIARLPVLRRGRGRGRRLRARGS